jgi:hypothetical protein
MGRVRSAPAIAANEQFVSRAQTLLDQIRGLADLRIKIAKRLQRFSGRGNSVFQNVRWVMHRYPYLAPRIV